MYEIPEDGTDVPKHAGMAKDPQFYVFLYLVHWLHFISERNTHCIIKKQGGNAKCC
jgi:hypothetical protein